jgi:hypothetical protein
LLQGSGWRGCIRIGPEAVTAEHKEGFATEMLQGVFDAPGGVEQDGFMGQDDLGAGLVFQMVGDLLRQMVGVDNDFFDPGLLQLVNGAAEQRLRPPTWARGFGMRSVKGRMRVPSPAARMNALSGMVMGAPSPESILNRAYF